MWSQIIWSLTWKKIESCERSPRESFRNSDAHSRGENEKNRTRDESEITRVKIFLFFFFFLGIYYSSWLIKSREFRDLLAQFPFLGFHIFRDWNARELNFLRFCANRSAKNAEINRSTNMISRQMPAVNGLFLNRNVYVHLLFSQIANGLNQQKWD